jgi:hypothetical protein
VKDVIGLEWSVDGKFAFIFRRTGSSGSWHSRDVEERKIALEFQVLGHWPLQGGACRRRSKVFRSLAAGRRSDRQAAGIFHWPDRLAASPVLTTVYTAGGAGAADRTGHDDR